MEHFSKISRERDILRNLCVIYKRSRFNSWVRLILSLIWKVHESQSESTENFGFGWSQFSQNFTPPCGYKYLYDSFQHKDAKTLQIQSSFKGQFNTYDGSGYVFPLRSSMSNLQGNLSLLRQMNWIDRQTRAILVEFSAYNPNIRPF